MFLGLASLFVRQFGHAVLEPACHDEERSLLGYNTPNKTLIVLDLPRSFRWSSIGAGRRVELDGVVALADAIAAALVPAGRWVVVLGRVAVS